MSDLFRAMTAAVAVLGVLVSTGCSKNEAATSACSSMADMASCGACCTKNGASGHKFVTGGTCGCMGGSKGAAATTGAAATSFAGTYKSTWGTTVFTQDGNHIAATYPNGGEMTCMASGNDLDCDWKETKGMGKAKLMKDPTSGAIKGTWGMGTSATSGGPWTFTP